MKNKKLKKWIGNQDKEWKIMVKCTLLKEIFLNPITMSIFGLV